MGLATGPTRAPVRALNETEKVALLRDLAEAGLIRR
jgi:hypothetical protein